MPKDKMPKSNVKDEHGKMYECSACTSVFILIQFRRPESMPCLREPLNCPYCMASGNTLIRIHRWPDNPRKDKS